MDDTVKKLLTSLQHLFHKYNARMWTYKTTLSGHGYYDPDNYKFFFYVDTGAIEIPYGWPVGNCKCTAEVVGEFLSKENAIAKLSEKDIMFFKRLHKILSRYNAAITALPSVLFLNPYKEEVGMSEGIPRRVSVFIGDEEVAFEHAEFDTEKANSGSLDAACFTNMLSRLERVSVTSYVMSRAGATAMLAEIRDVMKKYNAFFGISDRTLMVHTVGGIRFRYEGWGGILSEIRPENIDNLLRNPINE